MRRGVPATDAVGQSPSLAQAGCARSGTKLAAHERTFGKAIVGDGTEGRTAGRAHARTVGVDAVALALHSGGKAGDGKNPGDECEFGHDALLPVRVLVAAKLQARPNAPKRLS
jgi:hypothetical protein